MYRDMKGSTHVLASPEIAVVAIPEDERVWVPQAPDVWFRPLMLNTRQGQWCNLLRVRRAGILSRHLHPNPVHGFVLKGQWFYREHQWVATEGSYVFEPPGEIHTLVVPGDVSEMITFFNIQGSMVYLDEQNKHVGYEDVFTKLDMCRAHYELVGLGRDYVDQIRALMADGVNRIESVSSSAAWASIWYAGKRVLVTGGTSGIGAGLARGFVEAGADVTATGVNAAEIEQARSDPLLSRARATLLDIRDGEAVKALIGALGELDIVINCAGVIRRGDELDPDVFQSVIDINLNGTMRICAAARPLLARSRGAIVNLASMLSFFGGGLVPGYAASKGGIAQLTKSLAIAYADDGVRVNAIAPGWIATPLTTDLQASAERSQVILGRTPLGRWGTPSDLLGGVFYLCSPTASFVTGTILVIDGGYAVT